MNEDILKFICFITGHDEQTVKQLYKDWQNKPPKITVHTCFNVGEENEKCYSETHNS